MGPPRAGLAHSERLFSLRSASSGCGNGSTLRSFGGFPILEAGQGPAWLLVVRSRDLSVLCKSVVGGWQFLT